MNNNEAMDLLELNDSQWISLSDLLSALATSLNQPKFTTQQLIAAFAIDMVRPVRVSFSDGTGKRLTDSNNVTDNERLSDIIAYQLMSRDEQQQLAESERRAYEDASIEFTIPALHDWIIQCDLPEIAKSLFGQWIETTQPVLIKNNLLVVTTDNNNTTQAPTESVLKNPEIIPYELLLQVSGRRSPAELKAWLISNGIAFHTGTRGRPFTTLAAANKSLGIINTISAQDNAHARPKRKIEL